MVQTTFAYRELRYAVEAVYSERHREWQGMVLPKNRKTLKEGPKTVAHPALRDITDDTPRGVILIAIEWLMTAVDEHLDGGSRL